MAANVSEGLANVVADFLATVFPAGAVLKFRSGGRPASSNTAPTGVLLGQFVLPVGPWTAAAVRQILKNGVWAFNALAAGDIGWARLEQAGDLGTTNTTDERMDFSVTETGGGGDVEVDNQNVEIGQSVTITNFFLGA